jgi:hypothetical protein
VSLTDQRVVRDLPLRVIAAKAPAATTAAPSLRTNGLPRRSRFRRRRRSDSRSRDPTADLCLGLRRPEIEPSSVDDLDLGRPGFLIDTVRKRKPDQDVNADHVHIFTIADGQVTDVLLYSVDHPAEAAFWS